MKRTLSRHCERSEAISCRIDEPLIQKRRLLRLTFGGLAKTIHSKPLSKIVLAV